MARSWAELLGDEASAPDEAERTGLFSRLRESLGKSRRALTEELALGSFDPADDASWERLEEALIAADVGVPATAELVQRLESRGDGTDLAARLPTQTNRMEELAKVRRVIGQRLEGAPHETLLVIDATTGQNGLQQARLFGQAVDVSGVALTKLDGSAKGGIAVAIAHELGLPVKLVGLGEKLEDLQPFDPQDFARALVGG